MEGRSRSRSYAADFNFNNNMQIEVYGNGAPPPRSYDHRSYSTGSHVSSVYQQSIYGQPPTKDMRLKKGKSTSGCWGVVINDPELQRKKRIAGYKVYSVEGKVKGSFRKSFRWLKDRYTQVLYGWW